MTRRWQRAIGLALAALVLVLIARQVAGDWHRLPRDAFHLDPLPLAAAWLLQTAGGLLVVDTWRRMLRTLSGPAAGRDADRAADRAGGPGADPRVSADPAPDVSADPDRLPLARHLQIYAYTALAHVVPGSVLAPASRVALYRGHGLSGLVVGAALAIEWLLLGLGGLVLWALAAPFAGALPSTQVTLAVPTAGLIALVVLHPAAFGRVLRAAARRLGQEAPPRPPGRTLIGWLARETVVLALSGLALYLLMRAVSPAASLADAMSVWALSVAIANLLAWLPLTVFIKDGAMVLLLVPLYGSSVIALGVVVAWRLWMVLVELSWAGLATLAVRHRPAAANGTVGETGGGASWTG